MQICQSLIGGKPVTSPLRAIDKIYPATGEIVAKIEPATQEMLDEAVAVAAFAQSSWAVYEPLARARILHRAAALMREEERKGAARCRRLPIRSRPKGVHQRHPRVAAITPLLTCG